MVYTSDSSTWKAEAGGPSQALSEEQNKSPTKPLRCFPVKSTHLHTKTTELGLGMCSNPGKGVTCTDSTAPALKQPAHYLPDVLCHILGVNEDRKQAVDVLLKLIVAF